MVKNPYLRYNFEHNLVSALNSIPNGWMKSFMPNFKEELFEALGEYADAIMFYQIKEKFGELVAYWNFPDEDYYTDDDYVNLDKLVPVVEDIIKKYTEISKNTCVMCGEAAVMTTIGGWIAPFCDKCKKPKLHFE